MTVTITTTPALITPGKPARVAFSASEPLANMVRMSCTSAPRGSKLREKLDASSGTSVVDVCAGDTGLRWTFVGETSGTYTFIALECTRGASAHGGGYYGDTESAQTETVLASNTVTISVGSRMETTLGVGPDTAALVCYVFGVNAQATYLDVHGETTPAVAKPKSPKARTAAESADVTSAVAALAGVAAAATVGNLESKATDMCAWFEAHRASTAYHAVADTDNALISSLSAPVSPSDLAATLNDLRAKLDRHARNDNGQEGTGSAGYHAPGGVPVATSPGLLCPACSPTDRASQVALISDLLRTMVAHAASSAHASPDESYLPVNSRLMAVHGAFLAALADSAPTPPASANYGAIALIHNGGFTEA